MMKIDKNEPHEIISLKWRMRELRPGDFGKLDDMVYEQCHEAWNYIIGLMRNDCIYTHCHSQQVMVRDKMQPKKLGGRKVNLWYTRKHELTGATGEKTLDRDGNIIWLPVSSKRMLDAKVRDYRNHINPDSQMKASARTVSMFIADIDIAMKRKFDNGLTGRKGLPNPRHWYKSRHWFPIEFKDGRGSCQATASPSRPGWVMTIWNFVSRERTTSMDMRFRIQRIWIQRNLSSMSPISVLFRRRRPESGICIQCIVSRSDSTPRGVE